MLNQSVPAVIDVISCCQTILCVSLCNWTGIIKTFCGASCDYKVIYIKQSGRARLDVRKV